MSRVLEYWKKQAQVNPNTDGSFWELRLILNEIWSVLSKVATFAAVLGFDHWSNIEYCSLHEFLVPSIWVHVLCFEEA